MTPFLAQFEVTKKVTVTQLIEPVFLQTTSHSGV